MANEILLKSRSQFSAQASGALTAGEDPSSGSYTGGAATALDNTYDGGAENCKGAHWVELELDVTSAPTTDAAAEIWWRGSNDNSTWTEWKYSHTVSSTIASAGADYYDAGMFFLRKQYTELKVKAIDYGFTSQLYATPKLPEAQ
jgi:hypothetical protein